jgi:hypothetical protein
MVKKRRSERGEDINDKKENKKETKRGRDEISICQKYIMKFSGIRELPIKYRT